MIRHLPEIVEKARLLREQKLSFQEISRVLNVPSGTIRHWCYDLGIDRHESLRLNNALRRKIVKDLDISSVPLMENISSEQARLFASLLYGCEGGKYPATSAVYFVNSDPNLVKTFISLLRKGFELEEKKFRVHLQIHTTHDFKKLKGFWSELLGISPNLFLRPTITTRRGKMRRQNYSGTCSLRYVDYKIQLRLLGLFEKFCTNSGGVA